MEWRRSDSFHFENGSHESRESRLALEACRALYGLMAGEWLLGHCLVATRLHNWPGVELTGANEGGSRSNIAGKSQSRKGKPGQGCEPARRCRSTAKAAASAKSACSETYYRWNTGVKIRIQRLRIGLLAGAWPGEERGQGAASLKDAPEAGMRIAESSLVVNQIEKTGDPPECLKVAVFEEVVERAGVGPS